MGVEALAIMKHFDGAGVLCVGDIMLDRYIYGNASRISPEAPVPVVHVQREVHIPGGVGNVAKNLSAFGVNSHTVSVVGDDASANLLETLLSASAGASIDMIRDSDRPTIVKTRIIAGIQQVVRYDQEKPVPVSAASADRVAGNVAGRMRAVGALALSDYAKGVLTPDLTQRIIKEASAAGKPVAIDPKGGDYSKYRGADLVKPNRKELAEAVGKTALGGDEDIAEAARSLMRNHGIKNLLVTLSEKGMVLFRSSDDGRQPIILPSRAREVFDVTGAGDTVLAAMAASMAAGESLELGARLATLAAGVVVAKVGTATATAEEIERMAKEEAL